MTRRKPDYRLATLVKNTDEKGAVGAAWIQDNGTIAIVLDPFITLQQHGRKLLLTLFPFDAKNNSKDRQPPEDEIPF